MNIPYNIPPLEDLLRNDASESEPLDVAELMKSVLSGSPVVTNPATESYAAKPGRADMETLLKAHHARFTPPEPTRAPSGNDIGNMVASIVAEQVKVLSPAGSRSVDEEAIVKQASGEGRRNGLLEWMRRQIGNGETVESLVKFAEDNGRHGSAEQFRELAKQL